MSRFIVTVAHPEFGYYVVGTTETESEGRWAGLKEWVSTWVNSSWDKYPPSRVLAFREALLEGDVDTAWNIQDEMDDSYVILVDDLWERVGEPFTIESDFPTPLEVHRLIVELDIYRPFVSTLGAVTRVSRADRERAASIKYADGVYTLREPFQEWLKPMTFDEAAAWLREYFQ